MAIEEYKEYIEYYDEDKKQIKLKTHVNAQGNYVGPYEGYHENGQLSKRCTYENGRLNGPYESYCSDGSLWEKCTYKNGEEDGEFYARTYGGTARKGRYKKGELDGPYIEWNRETGALVNKGFYKDGVDKTAFSYRYFFDCRSHSMLDFAGQNWTKLRLDNSSESGGCWYSTGPAPKGVYFALSLCSDLEILRLEWMNVDAKAISHCKKLKSLEIEQRNMYGRGEYSFTGEDLKDLGTLPVLESLSISAPGLTDKDMANLHKQFPKLKYLELTYTDVTREGAELISKQVPYFKVESMKRGSKAITHKTLAKIHDEEARVQGLIGEGYQDKFREAVAKGDADAAFEILYLNGKIQRREKEDKSRFEREWNTPTSMGWGTNELDTKNIFTDVQMKDLGNGNVAFVTQYEDQYWYSTVGSNNDIQYSYSGDFCVVNPDKGVLASKEVKFDQYREPIELKIKNGEVILKGKGFFSKKGALSINPTENAVQAQLDKAAQNGKAFMLEAARPKHIKRATNRSPRKPNNRER